MIRLSAFVLAIYSSSMVLYGGAEMLHDLLHYMANHYHYSLHNHSHHDHHTLHDHEPHHIHHNHATTDVKDSTSEPQQKQLLLINFLLFMQCSPRFFFLDCFFTRLQEPGLLCVIDFKPAPSTPPPKFN